MLKKELARLERLADKNAEKTTEELKMEIKSRNVKKKERERVDQTLRSSDAHRLFNDMNQRSQKHEKDDE